MLRVASLFLASILLLPTALAQPSDMCEGSDGVMAVGQTTDGPTDFFLMNGAEANPIGSISGLINGLGYYDGRAYASRVRSRTVLEISLVGGSVAITDSFTVADLPIANVDAGAVRPGTSDYYVYRRRTSDFYRIPLEDRGASYSALTPDRALNTADFAFIDDAIVGFDSWKSQLYRIDPESGAIDDVGSPDLNTTLYAGAYHVNGDLYLYNDGNKRMSVVDPNSGEVLSSFATPYAEPTSQIDAASCPTANVAGPCQPILDLRADVLALALPKAVEEALLSDLDVALFNCSRGRYTLTAVALLDFLTEAELNVGVAIDISDFEVLTAVVQSILSGLPEDTAGTDCMRILDLRADVIELGLSDGLEDLLLADLDAALVNCGAGLVPDLVRFLGDFVGTVALNTFPLGELSLGEAATLTTAANALITLFSSDARTEAAAVRAAPETRVYPNPAASAVTVEAPGAFEARVYDLTGRLVREAASAGGAAEIAVAGLSAGMYVVRVESADGVRTVKLTVAR